MGILIRAYSVFKVAIDASELAAKNVVKPNIHRGMRFTHKIINAYENRRWQAYDTTYNELVWTGAFALTSFYLIGGAAAVGAVAVPLAAGTVYSLYSLRTYLTTPATKATLSNDD